MELEEQLKSIRKEFYAYRNGIVADALRKGGDPHQLIMGCQLTDIINITSAYGKDRTLANALWADTKHRECRLAAPMICPAEHMTIADAEEWSRSVACVEEADVICHRLLRHLPYAMQLFHILAADGEPMVRYVAFRLLLNLVVSGKVTADAQLKAMVEAESPNASAQLRPVLNSLLEDL
ncbi:MAG: DNA alkylation repair protein [Bacteroidales bacterium]|nr:DNA alkylation repair protein [Bacteroidales bacterium]MDY3912349.1 DNA alkylation repair protein [Sodaliphilus sp.]